MPSATQKKKTPAKKIPAKKKKPSRSRGQSRASMERQLYFISGQLKGIDDAMRMNTNATVRFNRFGDTIDPICDALDTLLHAMVSMHDQKCAEYDALSEKLYPEPKRRAR
jgi:enamine deaminase RidA (YjgF/YER057c/UK114 family)